jgi:hypothetical protein
MNTNKRIDSFFKRFTSTSVEDNTFVPHDKKKSLRIAKTIEPENRASFNEVFENVRECLKG